VVHQTYAFGKLAKVIGSNIEVAKVGALGESVGYMEEMVVGKRKPFGKLVD
jgi:hypothetical protein